MLGTPPLRHVPATLRSVSDLGRKAGEGAVELGRIAALGGAALAGTAAGAASALAGVVRQGRRAAGSGEDAGVTGGTGGTDETPVAKPPLAPTTDPQDQETGGGPEPASPTAEEVPDRAADLPVAKWDGRSPADLTAAVRHLPEEQLQVLLEWEREHGHRVAVMTMLSRRIDAVRDAGSDDGSDDGRDEDEPVQDAAQDPAQEEQP